MQKIIKQTNRPLLGGEVLMSILTPRYNTKLPDDFLYNFYFETDYRINLHDYVRNTISNHNRHYHDSELLFRFESQKACNYLYKAMMTSDRFTKQQIGAIIIQHLRKYPLTAIICDNGCWDFLYTLQY